MDIFERGGSLLDILFSRCVWMNMLIRFIVIALNIGYQIYVPSFDWGNTLQTAWLSATILAESCILVFEEVDDKEGYEREVEDLEEPEDDVTEVIIIGIGSHVNDGLLIY